MKYIKTYEIYASKHMLVSKKTLNYETKNILISLQLKKYFVFKYDQTNEYVIFKIVRSLAPEYFRVEKVITYNNIRQQFLLPDEYEMTADDGSKYPPPKDFS